MAEAKLQYGLMIERKSDYGTEYVVARVVRRKDDKPYGCSSSGEFAYCGDPKHLNNMQLDGLCLHGFVSDSDYAYIGFEPEYRDVYSVDLPKADRMARTLKKVVAQQRKDHAREPGDVMVALCKALKLSFVCHRIGEAKRGYYHESDWHFMSVEEGRNYYRGAIEQAQGDVRERKTGKREAA
jgi:hypothetical protein